MTDWATAIWNLSCALFMVCLMGVFLFLLVVGIVTVTDWLSDWYDRKKAKRDGA